MIGITEGGALSEMMLSVLISSASLSFLALMERHL
jgi:hypothetical protein